MTWPTIFEVASNITAVDLSSMDSRVPRNNKISVTHGLVPEPAPLEASGLVTLFLSPEQVASLVLPLEGFSDHMGNVGIQRDFSAVANVGHVRKIARGILRNEPFEPVIVARLPDGRLVVVDGGHRCGGAILARRPILVTIIPYTYDAAAILFRRQSLTKPVPVDQQVRVGDSPLDNYVRYGINNPASPWYGLVAEKANKDQIGPNTALNALGVFVYDTIAGNTVQFQERSRQENVNSAQAALLAELVRAFAPKRSRPAAFKHGSVTTIAKAAAYIVNRNPTWKGNDDLKRWRDQMPNFDFVRYEGLNAVDRTRVLVDHWNKRLQGDRIVIPANLDRRRK